MDKEEQTLADPLALGVLSLTDAAGMTIVQVREDPENYVEGSYPDLYLIDTQNSGYLFKMVYNKAAGTIDLAAAIVIPAAYHISMTPEHVDVGRLHFVVLSPIDCSAKETTSDGGTTVGTEITNPSARIYTFSKANGEPNADPWDEEGEGCYDLPASDPAAYSPWALEGTRRRFLDD